MTEEQINTAIDKITGCDGNECRCEDCHPDYCNDLNAIYSAVGNLSDGQLWEMSKHIPTQHGLGFRATAREQAEAMLKALGKWEETE